MPSCHLERYGICTTQDSTSVGWEGNLSVSALGLSGGYCHSLWKAVRFPLRRRWNGFYATPSAVKGEGIATISMDSRAALQYNASAGLDYRISEKISNVCRDAVELHLREGGLHGCEAERVRFPFRDKDSAMVGRDTGTCACTDEDTDTDNTLTGKHICNK